MPAPDPVFSIVIPTYNRAHLIDKTVHSVLGQTFTDFEVIIVDDGSKDNTAEVVAGISDKRVRYYKKDNGERGAARNYGRGIAKGKYVNFFDSDDLMYPNHLAEASSIVQRHHQPEFFHLAYDYQLEDGAVISRMNNFDSSLSSAILFDNKLSCNGVFLRYDIAREFPFEENRVLASSEDWELWIRLVCRFPLHISNEITSSVVNHDQRSLRTIAAGKVISRDLFFIEKLRQDTVVMGRYGKAFNKFIAQRYTFFMLSLSEEKQPKQVFGWAWQAFRKYPPIFFSKRFLASLRNSIRL